MPFIPILISILIKHEGTNSTFIPNTIYTRNTKLPRHLHFASNEYWKLLCFETNDFSQKNDKNTANNPTH